MFHDPFENYKSSIVYLTKRVVQLLTCREHNMKNSARPFLSFEHFNNLFPIKLFLRLGRIVVLRPKDTGSTIAELHKDTSWLNFFDNLFVISNLSKEKLAAHLFDVINALLRNMSCADQKDLRYFCKVWAEKE